MMKSLVGISVALCLLTICPRFAVAQETADGQVTPPKVLVIDREFVKPGKSGMMHDKAESAFVRAMIAAKSSNHYFAMTSMSGPSRALFFFPFDSFAAWEKVDQEREQNATLSAALERAQVADGDILSSYDSSAWTYNDELSLNSSVKIAEMRYMEITAIKVRPGHRQDWTEVAKLYKQGFANVPDMRWAIFDNMYGKEAGGVRLVITPMRSLAEVDQHQLDYKQFTAALGPDRTKKLSALSAAGIESAETNLFRFNPKMSYAPDAWIKADPGFWKVNEAPAKKAPAAAKQ